MSNGETPELSDEGEVFSLMYLSEALQPFSDASLQHLGVQSSAANALQGITGYLSYRQGRFTQYLEGERSAVLALVQKIEADERHSILARTELGKGDRVFPGWSMQVLDPLWYAIGGPVDAIDELLALAAGSADSDEITKQTLSVLVAQISVST